MIVVDASVVIEWLLRTDAGIARARSRLPSGERFHAPHLLDIEVTQALRRCSFTGQINGNRGQDALDDLLRLRIRRYPHKPLLRRVWELRGNLTAYDALYIALAESLGATLLTRDGKLAAAPGHRARVQLV